MGTLTYKGAVMTWECDSNRHMNVMYFVNKFEHAGRNFCLDLGLVNIDRSKNIGIVALEQKIKYLKEVFEDDLLYIESSLIGVGNKAFTIFHKMYNRQTNELLSTMEVVLVLFDKQVRKAIPFSADQKKYLVSQISQSKP